MRKPVRRLSCISAGAIASLFVLLAPWAQGQLFRLRADRNRAAQRQLFRLEQIWNQAFNNHDARTLDQLLAEDFLFVDNQGNVMGKAGYIRMVQESPSNPGDLKEMIIRTYGDTGVVVARWAPEAGVSGADVDLGTFRYTDTWVRRGSRWFAIASQDTSIPE